MIMFLKICLTERFVHFAELCRVERQSCFLPAESYRAPMSFKGEPRAEPNWQEESSEALTLDVDLSSYFFIFSTLLQQKTKGM